MNFAATWISHHFHESCRSHCRITLTGLLPVHSSINRLFDCPFFFKSRSHATALSMRAVRDFRVLERSYRNQISGNTTCRPPNLASPPNPDAKYGVYICGRLNGKMERSLRSSSHDQSGTLRQFASRQNLRPSSGARGSRRRRPDSPGSRARSPNRCARGYREHDRRVVFKVQLQ
jgi:hypothetical protein